ncbi:MAG: endonuclease III [Lentisphaerae bacterium]|nr:endonuclease III [Lentisphaerota bacterium]
MIKDKKAQFLHAVHDKLFEHYGELGCPLLHDSPFQLLIAVLLSAQCKDDRVNMVTPELFAKYPDAQAMSQASVSEIGTIIQSLGLWRNKAENIVKLSRKIAEEFNNQIPADMEKLTSLPGIGRKSANVVLGNAFNIPGFPVDTHVQRLMKHFALASAKDSPEKIEEMVCKRIEPDKWSNFSHLLITHGRRICIARKPQCQACIIQDLCPAKQAGLEKGKKTF